MVLKKPLEVRAVGGKCPWLATAWKIVLSAAEHLKELRSGGNGWAVHFMTPSLADRSWIAGGKLFPN